MWCTGGRDQYFTVDNSTTYRIESLWHHLELMLGKENLVDNCVRGIWLQLTTHSHQQSVALFGVRSRSPSSNLRFLDAVQRRLSDFAFKFFREVYDHAVVGGGWVRLAHGGSSAEKAYTLVG